MKRKKIGESILQWLFVNYLRLLEKTVHIEWHEDHAVRRQPDFWLLA